METLTGLPWIANAEAWQAPQLPIPSLVRYAADFRFPGMGDAIFATHGAVASGMNRKPRP